MKQMAWRPFPYGDRAYRYTGDALRDHWSRLHQGDLEPYPSPDQVAERIERCGAALTHELDPAALAAALQAAWRDYHAGDFGRAIVTAVRLGPIGAVVGARAQVAYATHLENDDREALALLCAASQVCEALSAIDPGDANAWFMHALALGRYAERISVVKALARGLGGKIRNSLTTTLALEPEHAAAFTTFGVYHFEVIDKVGTVVGRVTHGASREAGVQCFEKALELDPDSPITHLEYARVLGLGRQGDKVQSIERHMQLAANSQPVDALGRLDVERARQALNFA